MPHSILFKYMNWSDGKGKCTACDYAIKLYENAKPFPIPNIHEPTLNKEHDLLIEIGLIS